MLPSLLQYCSHWAASKSRTLRARCRPAGAPGSVPSGLVIAGSGSAGGGPCEGDGSAGAGGRADRHVAWTGPASAPPGEAWTAGWLDKLAKVVLHFILGASIAHAV